jgi:hypothetical protein
MCRAVTCRECGKTTWAGCGQHIAKVEQKVPAADWCGHPDGGARRGGAGLLGRIFGRR